jgi:hypothetical protein
VSLPSSLRGSTGCGSQPAREATRSAVPSGGRPAPASAEQRNAAAGLVGLDWTLDEATELLPVIPEDGGERRPGIARLAARRGVVGR